MTPATIRHMLRFGPSTCCLLAALRLSAAPLDHDGRIYFQDFSAGSFPEGWYGYRGDNATIYVGRADGEWVRVANADELRTGTSLGNRNSVNWDNCFAFVLRNATTNVIHCFALSYFAEQWSVGSVPMSEIQFSFGVFDHFTAELPNGLANPTTVLPHAPDRPEDFNTGYTTVPELNTSPFVVQAQPGPLDGKKARNRRRLFAVPDGLHWMPGQYLVLRWFVDRTFQPSLLAFDDLQFRTAQEGQIEFLGNTRPATNQVQFVACGFPATGHELQRSRDLIRWDVVSTLRSESGRLAFTVEPSEPHWFYRLLKK